MVRINKIYTRSGDDGQTALIDGSRVLKSSSRVEAYGQIDELNCLMGIAATTAVEVGSSDVADQLITIQSELFDLGSQLAAPPEFDKFPIFKVQSELIDRFENWIDQITEQLPPLTSFVLPGGTRLNGELHLARAVSRRVERVIVSLGATESVDPLTLTYFNRLSDYLFSLCRQESMRSKTPERLWQPATKR